MRTRGAWERSVLVLVLAEVARHARFQPVLGEGPRQTLGCGSTWIRLALDSHHDFIHHIIIHYRLISSVIVVWLLSWTALMLKCYLSLAGRKGFHERQIDIKNNLHSRWDSPLQSWSLLALLTFVEVLEGHTIHDTWPSWGWNDPFGHDWHSFSTTLKKVPTGHFTTGLGIEIMKRKKRWRVYVTVCILVLRFPFELCGYIWFPPSNRK